MPPRENPQGTSAPDPLEPTRQAPAGSSPRRPSPLGRALRALGFLAATLILLAAATVALLQIDAVATAAVRTGLALWLPGDASATVGRVSGGVLRSLTIDTLVIHRGTGDTALVADRVRVGYDLRAILSHHLALREVALDNPRVTLTRIGDSTWAFLPAPTIAGDTVPAPWLITIDRLTVTNGSLTAPLSPDSAYRITGAGLTARDLRLGDTSHGSVDSLVARLTVPGHPDEPGSLYATLSWDGPRLRVDTLAVSTAASRVTASGAISLDLARPFNEHTRFVARADPLALDELTPFFPAVGGAPIVVTLEARGDTSGALKGTAQARLSNGGVVDLDGTVRAAPGTPIVISVGGDFRDVDPATMLTAQGAEGSLRGRLTVELAGSDLRHLSGDIGLVLNRSRVRTYETSAARVTAHATQGHFRFDGTVALAPYRISAEGEIHTAAASPGYHVSGQVRGGTLGSGTLFFTADGRGVSPADPMALTLRAAVPAGSLTARLTARPFAEQPGATIHQGRASRVDLRVLYPTAPHTNLNGSLSGTVVGFEPRTAVVRLAVKIDSSAVGAEPLTDGDVALDLMAGRLELDGTLRFASGPVRVDAEIFPFAEPIRYAVRESRFDGLDLGRLLERPAFRSSLHGSLTLEGAGLEPATRQLTTELTLDSSTVADLSLRSGRVTARLTRDSLDGNATARIGEGTVEGTVGLRLASDWRQSAGAARFSARAVSWRDMNTDSASATLRVGSGVFTVDTVWLRSNIASIEGGGIVPLVAGAPPATLRFESTILDLGPFASAFGTLETAIGSGSASFAVTGPADSLAFTGTGRVDALRYGAYRLVGVDAGLTGAASVDSGLRFAEGSLDLDRLLLPTGATVANTRLDARYSEKRELLIEGKTQVDANRTVALTARLDRATDRAPWTVEAADMSIGDQKWKLARPAQVHYANGLRIDDLLLEAPGRRIALNGTIGSAEANDFHLAVDSFPIEAVADLLGYHALAGTVTAEVDVKGTRLAPVGTATVAFEVRDPKGGSPGLVNVTGQLAAGRLELDGTVMQRDRTALTIAGHVPWPLDGSAGTLDLRVRPDSFALGFIDPFLDPQVAHDLSGVVSGDVQVTGTASDPSLSGQLTLASGRVQLPQLGVTWTDATIVAALSGRTIHLERAHLVSGPGTLEATGGITLKSVTLGELNLALEAREFRAIQSAEYRGVVSGKVDVRGTTEAPEIRGNVEVLRGDVILGGGIAGGQIEDVTLTDTDYAALEKYFGFPIRPSGKSLIPTLDALTLDITARLGRDSWLRQDANPKMAVQLTGDLRIRKSPGPALQLLGELETIPERSHVEQFHRRFELRAGTITFQGDRLDTRLNLTAAHTIPSRTDNEPEAVILLTLQGTVGDVKVVLSSEPSMSNGDIVSYLATGRPAGRALAFEGSAGSRFAATGTGLAIGQAAGLIESLAAGEFGLDVIEIRREGLEAATLVAGRYVSPTLYLGFKQPILSDPATGTAQKNQQRTRVEVELQAYRWLLLNFESGGDLLQFFLKARYGY